MQRALIIFVKNPVLGEVKTRLAASIGKKAALHVYHQLLRYTYNVTRQLVLTKYVYYNSKIGTSDIWDEAQYIKKLQVPLDLGERMMAALTDVINNVKGPVCLIGSDCPALTKMHIESAMKKLDEVDIVLGPTLDGGYYLIGLKEVYKELFEDIKWSTEQVLATTLERCAALGLKVSLLPKLSDVDVEADLLHYPWLCDNL